MLDCNVIVMARLKGSGGGEVPHQQRGSGGKVLQFGKCLFGLHILPYGQDEVRMRNLGVRLDC